MTDAQLLINIIKANEGIVVHNTFMRDIVREVYEETGVIIGSKRQQDYYDHPFQKDYDGDPRLMFRNNPRKYSLKIIPKHNG